MSTAIATKAELLHLCSYVTIYFFGAYNVKKELVRHESDHRVPLIFLLNSHTLFRFKDSKIDVRVQSIEKQIYILFLVCMPTEGQREILPLF